MTIATQAMTAIKQKTYQQRAWLPLLQTIAVVIACWFQPLQASNTQDDYVIVELALPATLDNVAKNTAANDKRPDQVGDGEWLSFNNYIEAAQRDLANDMGWQNVADLVSYQHLPYMAVPKSVANTQALLASGKVAKVFPNEFHLTKQTSTQLPQNLQLISPLPATKMQQAGRGVTVAMIDDGVLSSHPSLQGKIVAEACVSRAKQCQDSVFVEGYGAADPGDQSHGTHIAGIIVGPQGVAAASQLVAVKANFRSGAKIGFYDVDVLSAIDWVVAQQRRYDIAALNLSLGDNDEYSTHCDDQTVYGSAIKRAVQAGIVVVVAAGNEHRTNGLISPACVSDVISVGAVTANRTVADYSNTSAYLSLLAPGDNIRSTGVPSGTLEMSGTSMAAPHVTASIAVLKSQYPQATSAELRRAIVQSRHQVQDIRTGRLTPLLDLTASAQYLENQKLPPPQPRESNAPAQPVPVTPVYTAPVTHPTIPKPAVPKPAVPKPVLANPAPAKPKPVPTPAKKSPVKAKKPSCAERVDGILVENNEACAEQNGIDW
ncbi:S8 family serine peptidase [Rheinheimera sp. F8]|uniref:S8 family peptidase n=1 Tax=Rheinheimera sp. F8 TaxID=1763998 RepID=UPI0007449503|nr:S8 family serine peptidase [Rheinheimera sp. F8]ALZ76745.1 hypothetical protein ATY27_13885 [Rheinheimera sp. F8]